MYNKYARTDLIKFVAPYFHLKFLTRNSVHLFELCSKKTTTLTRLDWISFVDTKFAKQELFLKSILVVFSSSVAFFVFV